jgi:hypothetical protein
MVAAAEPSVRFTVDGTATYGTLDIPAHHRGQRLAAAGTTGPGLRLLSGVNHLLRPPGAVNDDQVLAPSVVTALQAWARAYDERHD